MQLPTKQETPWESSDASALRLFFESKTGQRALTHLNDLIPSLLDGSDVNKTLVTNGEVKGWNNALRALLNLTIEQPAPIKIPEAYPSLDDEDAWKEDKKPETTNP
jgi:hypothetical protein